VKAGDQSARCRAAARNNAAWCGIVCDLHGIANTVRQGAWIADRRSPPFFPDAVTLEPTTAAPSFLPDIDDDAGCSVKDSFATLDLAGDGFRVLFEARWLYRPGTAEPGPVVRDLRMRRVLDADELIEWELAWSDGAVGLFPPALLQEATVAVLGGYANDRLVAGAIANLASGVVGVSNVFTTTGDLDVAWRGCLSCVAELFPDTALVGYESGEALEVARRRGFEEIGPLRVWTKGDV
jgi:hypothetical protein